MPPDARCSAGADNRRISSLSRGVGTTDHLFRRVYNHVAGLLAFTGSISDRLRLLLSNSLTHLSHHEQHAAHRPAVER